MNSRSTALDGVDREFVGGVSVTVLASSAVDREFIGGVIVTVLASSAVDREFIGGVIVTVLASSAVDRGALEASTVTITPPMWSYLNTRSEENYEVRYYNEHNVSMDKKLLLYIQQLFNFVSIETLDNIIGDSFLSCYHITL
jgi:hypothetical protein